MLALTDDETNKDPVILVFPFILMVVPLSVIFDGATCSLPVPFIITLAAI